MGMREGCKYHQPLQKNRLPRRIILWSVLRLSWKESVVYISPTMSNPFLSSVVWTAVMASACSLCPLLACFNLGFGVSVLFLSSIYIYSNFWWSDVCVLQVHAPRRGLVLSSALIYRYYCSPCLNPFLIFILVLSLHSQHSYKLWPVHTHVFCFCIVISLAQCYLSLQLGLWFTVFCRQHLSSGLNLSLLVCLCSRFFCLIIGASNHRLNLVLCLPALCYQRVLPWCSLICISVLCLQHVPFAGSESSDSLFTVVLGLRMTQLSCA